MPDDIPLTPATILAHCESPLFPREVRCYAQTTSTMDRAREALQTLPDDKLPLLVLTEEQTAGRGRSGRSWVAPSGSALLFSIGLRPTWLTPADAPLLTWWACVALCEGISAVTELQPYLKWPNDVVVQLPDMGATVPIAPPQGLGLMPPACYKIAGTLVELSSSDRAISWAVIGCGLNVSAGPADMADLRYPATYLTAVLGHTVSRLVLLRALLQRMHYWYLQLQAGERQSLFTTWRARLLTLGREVQVTTSTGILRGWAEDVEASGALCVRDAAGMLHTITSGDVM